MRIPIAFRLLMLLVLAWRLIVAGKKKFENKAKSYENLNTKPEVSFQKPEVKNSISETYKEYFRKKVRNQQDDSQYNFMVFMAQKLEKHYMKGGIFRLFWYDQSLVIAFFQSLIKINLLKETAVFEQILIKISSEGFNLVKTNQIEKLRPDTFSINGDDEYKEFEDFDASFSVNKYLWGNS